MGQPDGEFRLFARLSLGGHGGQHKQHAKPSLPDTLFLSATSRQGKVSEKFPDFRLALMTVSVRLEGVRAAASWGQPL